MPALRAHGTAGGAATPAHARRRFRHGLSIRREARHLGACATAAAPEGVDAPKSQASILRLMPPLIGALHEITRPRHRSPCHFDKFTATMPAGAKHISQICFISFLTPVGHVLFAHRPPACSHAHFATICARAKSESSSHAHARPLHAHAPLAMTLPFADEMTPFTFRAFLTCTAWFDGQPRPSRPGLVLPAKSGPGRRKARRDTDDTRRYFSP